MQIIINHILLVFTRQLTIFSTTSLVVLNYEADIGYYTIRVAIDPRACNRTVIYRPSTNIVSQLELISFWEKKTGREFKRIYVSEEELVRLSTSK